MTMFEPLREGFRELNRLVTDRQTFNAQHEARQWNDQKQNTILASQLEERAFNRAATEKKLLMGAEMNEFEKELARDKFEQAKYQFETNTDLKTQQAELDAANAESSRSFRQKQMDQITAQLEENLDWNDPRPVSELLDGIGWRDAAPETKERLAEKVYGALYDRNLDMIVDKDSGEEIKVSARGQNKVQNMARGILTHDLAQTQQRNMKRVAEINTTLAGLQKEMKFAETSAGADIRNRSKLSRLKAQSEGLKKELFEAEKLAGEQGRLQDRAEKIDQLERAALQAYRVKDDKAGDQFTAEIKALRAQEDAEIKAAAGTGKEGKTKSELVIQVDQAGNPVHGTAMMYTFPTGKRGAAVPPEGYAFASEYNINNKAEAETEAIFDKSIKELYHTAIAKNGDFIVGVENHELAEGLLSVMRLMRNADPKAPGLTEEQKADAEYWQTLPDAKLASVAKQEHARAMKEYVERHAQISAIVNDEDREALFDELEESTIAALGSLPTRAAYEKMLELNLIEQHSLKRKYADEKEEAGKWY